MASDTPDQSILIQVLNSYTQIPYAHGELETDLIVDQAQTRYLLVTQGWDEGRRVYSVLADVAVRDGKFWIEHDNTEDGIATELVAAGVPHDKIVLGFRPPALRIYTSFAAA